MNVPTVVIGSRTRMKQRGIRTRYIFDDIPGLVRPFRASQQSFTILRIDLTRPTHVVIVGKISPDLEFPLQAVQVILPCLQQTRTGTFESDTCKKCTNLENVTTPRSSSERIISDSI